MKVRVLREPEIRELLAVEEAIASVEQSLADYSSGRAVMPGVINLDITAHQGEVHVKSAYLQGSDHYVIKIASGFYQNPSRGLPVGNGLLLLFAAETGHLECLLLDNGYITEMRTAAAGAAAARYLAKKDIKKVGIVGSGAQARYQLLALLAVRRPSEIFVWSRTRAHVQAYVEEMSARMTELRFRAAETCEEAVSGSDLVITVTPSRSPLIRPEWVSPGTHITAVGSDGPEKQELEAGVLAKADRIFCDSLRQCAALGEVHHGLAEKVISEENISGELGELVLGRKEGRLSDAQITVADLTGLGVQDAATASLVYEKALAKGLGDWLEL